MDGGLHPPYEETGKPVESGAAPTMSLGHGAGEERFEFDPWLAVKSARGRSRKPCGVRTRDKSTKRTPPGGGTRRMDPPGVGFSANI